MPKPKIKLKHVLTGQQENNLRMFVGMLADRHHTVKAVQKMMGNKRINWKFIYQRTCEKAMELMANPDASPYMAPKQR